MDQLDLRRWRQLIGYVPQETLMLHDSVAANVSLGDPEVILLGVDRLDYTKGIGLRLEAFGALLESGELDPERHVLVQVATPTREDVEHYQDERQEIERLVGEINGRFGRIGLPVIHYLYQTLGFDELIALYRAGDVMLVTPFRDGAAAMALTAAKRAKHPIYVVPCGLRTRILVIQHSSRLLGFRKENSSFRLFLQGRIKPRWK